MRWLDPLLERTKGDFRLASVLAVAAIVAMALLPFAAYRAAAGQWRAAAVDLGIVVAVVAIAAIGWQRRDVRTVGPVLAAFASLACIAVGDVIGLMSLFWTAPVLLGNYLMAPRRLALGLSLALIAGQALVHADHLPGALALASFVTTALMVMVCAHVAASFGETERVDLKDQATRDPLTDVDNRRAMEQALARITAADDCATLAVLDLDRFKRINDEHGHDAGDAVLVRFAQLVRATVRRSDRFFRMGGEEFVLLLPDCEQDGARRALEKVQAEVRAGLQGPGGPVTVSIGATVRRPGEPASAWLARADEAMYRVKREGRDGLAFAGATVLPAGTDAPPPISRL